MRRGTKRISILRAGAELFAEVGFEETGVKEIVDRAQTTTATFYKHFPTKSDLLEALVPDRLVRAFTAVQTAVAEASTVREQVLAAVQSGLHALHGDELLCGLLRHGLYGDRQDLFRRYYDQLSTAMRALSMTLITRANGTGELHVRDPEGTTVVILACVTGWCAQPKQLRSISTPRFELALLRLVDSSISFDLWREKCGALVVDGEMSQRLIVDAH